MAASADAEIPGYIGTFSTVYGILANHLSLLRYNTRLCVFIQWCNDLTKLLPPPKKNPSQPAREVSVLSTSTLLCSGGGQCKKRLTEQASVSVSGARDEVRIGSLPVTVRNYWKFGVVFSYRGLTRILVSVSYRRILHKICDCCPAIRSMYLHPSVLCQPE